MPDEHQLSSSELCDLLLATGSPSIWAEMNAALTTIAQRHGLIEATADNPDSVKQAATFEERLAAVRARARYMGVNTIDMTDLLTVEIGGQEEDVVITMETAEHLCRQLGFLLGHDDEPATESVKLPEMPHPLTLTDLRDHLKSHHDTDIYHNDWDETWALHAGYHYSAETDGWDSPNAHVHTDDGYADMSRRALTASLTDGERGAAEALAKRLNGENT